MAGTRAAMRRQILPFQCTMSGRSALVRPTAQTFPAEVAPTPRSDARPTARGGASRLQARPFQRKISGLPLLVAPTAQASRAEVAATADREPLPARAGLDVRVQAVPFQRRMSGLLLLVLPTAQAFRAEVAAIPASVPLTPDDTLRTEGRATAGPAPASNPEQATARQVNAAAAGRRIASITATTPSECRTLSRIVSRRLPGLQRSTARTCSYALEVTPRTPPPADAAPPSSAAVRLH